MAFRLALFAWQELQLRSLVLSLLSCQSRLPSATSLALLPDAILMPFGRTKSLALTLAAQGLHGLHGLHGLQDRFAPQGLQGLQAFLAAQGLHGLHPFFFTAQGLQGPHAPLVAQGLQGLQALARTVLRLAAQGFAVLAATATSAGAETVTSPLKTAAQSGLRLRRLGIRGVFMLLSIVKRNHARALRFPGSG